MKKRCTNGQLLLVADVVRKTARKVLGVSSGQKKEDRDTWWWNEEVQESIRGKRLAKKNWDNRRNEENRQEYKDMCRKVKRVVAKAKEKRLTSCMRN